MTEFLAGNLGQTNPNVIDRVTNRADKALDATRRVTNAAIDSVAGGVHSLRDRVSPALDQVASPLDTVVRYTHHAPVKALLGAAAAGALAMAVFTLLGRSRR